MLSAATTHPLPMIFLVLAGLSLVAMVVTLLLTPLQGINPVFACFSASLIFFILFAATKSFTDSKSPAEELTQRSTEGTATVAVVEPYGTASPDYSPQEQSDLRRDVADALEEAYGIKVVSAHKIPLRTGAFSSVVIERPGHPTEACQVIAGIKVYKVQCPGASGMEPLLPLS